LLTAYKSAARAPHDSIVLQGRRGAIVTLHLFVRPHLGV